MKKFICPIDKRVTIDVPDDLPTTWDIISEALKSKLPFPQEKVFTSIANCETDRPNSECEMIKWGCIGCRADKEELLRKLLKKGSVV